MTPILCQDFIRLASRALFWSCYWKLCYSDLKKNIYKHNIRIIPDSCTRQSITFQRRDTWPITRTLTGVLVCREVLFYFVLFQQCLYAKCKNCLDTAYTITALQYTNHKSYLYSFICLYFPLYVEKNNSVAGLISVHVKSWTIKPSGMHINGFIMNRFWLQSCDAIYASATNYVLFGWYKEPISSRSLYILRPLWQIIW